MLKRCFLIAMVTFFAASIGFAQKTAAGKKADPADAVKKAFESLVDGIRENDSQRVLSAYDKSDRILIFNNNGTATIGWDNIRSNVESSYPKITNVTLDITGLRIEMLGPTAAYLTCKWKQTQDHEGQPESASGRMTLIYRLIGKEWKIVHRHTSPDDPAPTRPVMPSEREPK